MRAVITFRKPQETAKRKKYNVIEGALRDDTKNGCVADYRTPACVYLHHMR